MACMTCVFGRFPRHEGHLAQIRRDGRGMPGVTGDEPPHSHGSSTFWPSLGVAGARWVEATPHPTTLRREKRKRIISSLAVWGKRPEVVPDMAKTWQTAVVSGMLERGVAPDDVADIVEVPSQEVYDACCLVFSGLRAEDLLEPADQEVDPSVVEERPAATVCLHCHGFSHL